MRFAADENFNNDILRGLKRQHPDLDVVRIQDTEIYQADDPAVLEWTAQTGRILLTHDVKTMPKYAFERIAAGLPVPGVFVLSDDMALGKAIEELLMIIEASEEGEWENLVIHLPFPSTS